MAQDQPLTTRQMVLQGAFAEAADTAEVSGRQQAAALFDQGLAAFALKDFERAAGLFAQVAQSGGETSLLIRAAVAASLALSKTGDRAGTCEYTGVVQPLVQDMPLLWRGWIEETRRLNNCN